MAYILKVDGTKVENYSTDLKNLQKAVGGKYIQIIPTKDGRILVINENGKYMGMPINLEATNLYAFGRFDPIVGDVVVCEQEEVKII